MALVYSTDPNFCPHCQCIPCSCNKADGKPKKQTEPVRVSFSRNAKGNGMTFISRIPMHPEGKRQLLKKFKQSLGCGGTVKEGQIELQGDKKTQVAALLEKEGYKVRIL